MSESNVLILQCDMVLKNYEMNELYDTILEQKEQGVILLPKYVKVVNVPEEVINGELVVTNSEGYKPEPERYVIKRVSGSKGGSYVLNVRPSYGRALLVDYTEYKMIALRFSETEANKLLKKLGNGYEMEEL
nr:MAG TPA: hypothetical protein [Bacteriophage sp.]